VRRKRGRNDEYQKKYRHNINLRCLIKCVVFILPLSGVLAISVSHGVGVPVEPPSRRPRTPPQVR